MKKFIITSVIALTMSMTYSTASATNHRNISSKQPTHNVANNNNSSYRNNTNSDRYNTQTITTRPKIGSRINSIRNASIVNDGRNKLYLSNGVIYRRILTTRGYVYEVVSYEIPTSWRR